MCNVLYTNADVPAASGSERKKQKDGDTSHATAGVGHCDERSHKNEHIYRRGQLFGNGQCMTQQPMS